MKIHQIDNSVKNLGKSVLWQYDRAVRLLSLMKYMQVVHFCSVEQFWNRWMEKVLSVDTCSAFGSVVLGLFLGVPRPIITDETGSKRPIVTSVYRKLLKGAFFLMKSGCSIEDLTHYLALVFGIEGKDIYTQWQGRVSEMGWTINLDELNSIYASGVAYEKGDVFYYASDSRKGNWKCIEDITIEENTSFDDIIDFIEETDDAVTPMSEDGSYALKLYDPENICRRMVSFPSSSLTLSLSYVFGDTEITATAKRSMKSGVQVVDLGNLAISYEKSTYYDSMHKDQKYLFEQKKEEVCPYPLGIKTNDSKARWVFGFQGQKNLYEAGKEYQEGDKFGYIESNETGFDWECTTDITSEENMSFDDIKGKISKVSSQASFIGTLAESDLPYLHHTNDFFTCLPVSYQLISNTELATFVEAGFLFLGSINGMDYVFKNSSGITLVVPWSSLDTNAWYEAYGESSAFSFAEITELTNENIKTALGELATTLGCPIIPSDQVATFIPNTRYKEGMVVKVNDEWRVMKQDAEKEIMASAEQAIEMSYRQQEAGLHEWYPISTGVYWS